MLKINPENFQRFIEDVDGGIGRIDPEAMANSAKRMARAYGELLNGYLTDPQSLLSRSFKSDFDELVIVKDISFASLCAHHALPYIGVAHVGYIPAGRILGLSKVARLIECLSHRFSIQEQLVSDIADALMIGIKPKGVAVVIEASHQCMALRGVRQPTSKTTVSAVRGLLKTDAKAKEEFLRLIK